VIHNLQFIMFYCIVPDNYYIIAISGYLLKLVIVIKKIKINRSVTTLKKRQKAKLFKFNKKEIRKIKNKINYAT